MPTPNTTHSIPKIPAHSSLGSASTRNRNSSFYHSAKEHEFTFQNPHPLAADKHAKAAVKSIKRANTYASGVIGKIKPRGKR